MMVLPAATARPASPARATFSMVRGPIEGRSKRRSWPGFGALTRTPTPGGEVTRPCRRSSAMRASISSVPSAASTASTWLLATIAAWPTSNGPSVAITFERARNIGCCRARTADGGQARLRERRFPAPRRWTPTTRKPPFSAMLATPDRSLSSPPRKAGDARHRLDRLPIEPQLRDRRPQHRTDEEHFPAILGAREPKKPPELPDGDPMMRIALDDRRRPSP